MNKPKSTIIFIIALFISIGVILATYGFQYLHWNIRHLIYLGFAQFLVVVITPLGIYFSIKNRNYSTTNKKLNMLGLWGNAILLIYTIAIMIYSLATS